MNPISRFLIEGSESRRIEGQLKRKLSELEMARPKCSPNELKSQMAELEDIEWRVKAFNKGLLFVECKTPYAVNFIDMRYYNMRINLLKTNLGYNSSNNQNI